MSDQKQMDSLEQFLKQKLENPEIRYREEDWEKLSHKLDLKDSRLAYRRKLQWVAAAALLIIGLLGYMTYSNYSEINRINEMISEQPTPETPLTDELPAGPGEITPPGQTGEEPTAQLRTDPPAVPALGDTDVITAPAAAERVRTEISSAESSVDGRLLTARPAPAARLDNKTLSQVPLPQPTHTDRSELQPESADPAFPSSPADMRTMDNRITVGLTASPDLSMAGSLSGVHSPGYKAGITAEFKLTSNLAITTGIMPTMVRYSAHSDRYNVPAYWPDGAPEEIVGECLLIDIPVGIKYDVINFNRSRIFASAGLSSYIMQNEEYRFFYNGSGQQPESWSGRTGTRHWFSNASLSIGYELDLHPKWSLRAEPFLKLPIREVGWGNVKLYSMGSFVSVNFRL